MCGIFGLVLLEKDNLYNLIINGLIQLQNRGYDSAGLCAINENKFEVYTYASTNEVNAIEKLTHTQFKTLDNYIGFGHNRWATHGGKTDINAHPHLSNSGNFAIVHNGIIENYRELDTLQEVINLVENAEKNGRKIAIFYAESLQSCGGQIVYPKNFLRKVYK